jgi:lysophospholipase L1-like esterase
MMTDLIATDPYTRDLCEATGLLAGAPWNRFAVLGDSHAAGVREKDAYPDRSWFDWVSEALRGVRTGFVAKNFASKGLLTREVRVKQLPKALDFAPDLAVVLCGGNDLLRGSLDGVEAEFDRMLTPLRESGCRIVTMGLFDITRSTRVPADFRPAISEQLAPLYSLMESVAMRHQTVHLNFGVHPACADDNIYASDSMHLTARGHAVVAATMVRALSELREQTLEPLPS